MLGASHFLHELQASLLWSGWTAGTRLPAGIISWKFVSQNSPLKFGLHLVYILLFIRTEGRKRPQSRTTII